MCDLFPGDKCKGQRQAGNQTGPQPGGPLRDSGFHCPDIRYHGRGCVHEHGGADLSQRRPWDREGYHRDGEGGNPGHGKGQLQHPGAV